LKLDTIKGIPFAIDVSSNNTIQLKITIEVDLGVI